MARLLFRKIYIVTVLVVGLTIWAFMVHLAPEGSLSQKDHHTQPSKPNQNQHKILTDTLNEIEGEIASQKIFSANLLNKLRDKYTNHRREGESNNVADGANDENQIQQQQISSSSLKTQQQDQQDKLLALQQELQQEAHHGEVQSPEANHPDAEHKGDPNYKDGEDFHQGEVLEVGAPPAVQEPHKSDGLGGKPSSSVIAVLVFVCNRPSVKRNLDQLFKHRPSSEKFPIIVSQDCGSHPATTSVIKSYGDSIIHIMQPDLREIEVPPKEKKLKGYYNIARHYGWALNHTYNTLGYDNVLIVEDDLDIAPDFFEYFAATLHLLYEDPTLWCISAWNDNGKPKRINETAYDLLHRTDFFPGLGWLMTKTLWAELMVKWPRGYWDDWMREPPQRKERACIRPEISRTSTFGKDGVSHGTYYQNHLRFIKLNEHFVPFTSMDLSYMHKDVYDVNFVKRVYSSQLVNSVEELKRVTEGAEITSASNIEYRLTYRTKADFRIFAKKLEIMDDFRAGVPRTAYRGVISFMFNNKRVYLAPGANWISYQP